MKTTLLCIITAVFFNSCSTEEDFETLAEQTNTVHLSALKNYFPANSSNPFDLKGKKIYDALNDYYENNKTVNSTAELADQIRCISEKFNEKGSWSSRLIPFTDEMVESIMADPDNSMITIVENSSLQTYAKTSLITFLQNFIIKRQQQFNITYSYIAGYESNVLDDAVFTTEERETVLTVTSISRYSLYSEEERKDKDWDILIGNKPVKRFFKSGEAALISVIALLEGLI
ncbi:hypothetical protein [Flavobacterium johnsoniae]|uniref:Uncharacterized protein n=1 Tax=Flavobacterium johnsoniae TaxID=986 RepID=A0A1J7BNQ7_FLAJO|nr:hypothetical protein [Flavobacterium johnsoniae]OIV40343.1 hypothetical protein BKM63_20620 [Flavobacterium johnsoniae]